MQEKKNIFEIMVACRVQVDDTKRNLLRSFFLPHRRTGPFISHRFHVHIGAF